MHTMHSTLLVGLYDWEPERLPRQEFEQRIEAFWNKMPACCAGVAVYGDRRYNAELAYFTNLVPKLRDALALLPRNGSPKVLVSGGANAMPPAARQTWLQTVDPLPDLGKAIAAWQAELGGPVALIGGEQLRQAVRKGADDALGGEALSGQAAAVLREQMRCKRPVEIAAIGESCAKMKAVVEALDRARRKGLGVTAALIEAEHAAVGAEEVRTLFSLDGGKTLRPFTTPIERAVDPLQVYIAVRHLGYWADAYILLSNGSHAARDKASQVLKAAIGAAKPGVSCGDIAELIKSSIAPYREHPLTAGEAGGGIGLALEETPRLIAAGNKKIRGGDVCSLRVGVSDGASHAIVSAMIAITERGSEVLWS